MNEAVRKAGPRALTLAEEAGEHGPQVMRLLARHGDDAARVLSRPQGLALAARHGDEAAEALIRHPAAAPLIEAHGSAAVRALRAIEPQNGRRLAMLAQGGDLARIGRTEELLEVIAKYGNRAAAFVWENKGALAVAACLTAFLMDPEPFLDGTKELAKHVTHTFADAAIKPVAEVPAQMTKEMAKEVAKDTNWTLIFITALGIGGALFAGRMWLRRRRPNGGGIILLLLVLALPARGQPDPAERAIVLGARRAQLESEAKADIRRGMDPETVQRRLQRDMVLLEVGPEADRLMKVHGYPAIYLLRTCGNDTAKKLVQLFEGGELHGLELARVIEVVNRHGHSEPVAAWVCGNHHRLRSPRALEVWEEKTLDYVFDLRVLEEDVKIPRERPKLAAADAVWQWVKAKEHWPVLGVAGEGVALAWWLRRRRHR